MEENTQRKHDRKFFEQLLKDVDQQTRRTAQEQEQSLLSEDPMGINYARWATEAFPSYARTERYTPTLRTATR